MKKRRPFYLKAVVQASAVRDKKTDLEGKRKVLRDCGLIPESKKIDKLIRQCEQRIIELGEEARQQRKALARVMLLCFAAGDIATTCADTTADTFDELTFGWEKEGGNELADIFRQQAENWNKCVQVIDGDGEHGSEQVSAYYADMAEDLVGRVIPIMWEVIDEYMNTEKGKRLL